MCLVRKFGSSHIRDCERTGPVLALLDRKDLVFMNGLHESRETPLPSVDEELLVRGCLISDGGRWLAGALGGVRGVSRLGCALVESRGFGEGGEGR